MRKDKRKEMRGADDKREKLRFVLSSFQHESPRWPLEGLVQESHLPSLTHWLIRQILLLSKPGFLSFLEQDIYVIMI